VFIALFHWKESEILMSQNSQAPSDLIPAVRQQATIQHAAMLEKLRAARAAKAAKEQEYYSDFGRKHGGSDKLHTMVITAKAVALVGAFLLTMILTNAFHIDGVPALTIVVGFLGLVLIFDLVVCVLYLRLRRFLKLLAYLALYVGLGAGGLAAIFYTVLHV
jgi:hypothetical protein